MYYFSCIFIFDLLLKRGNPHFEEKSQFWLRISIEISRRFIVSCLCLLNTQKNAQWLWVAIICMHYLFVFLKHNMIFNFTVVCRILLNVIWRERASREFYVETLDTNSAYDLHWSCLFLVTITFKKEAM